MGSIWIEKFPAFLLSMAISLVLIFIQSSVLQHLLPRYLLPNLLFIFLIYIALNHKNIFGIILCFFMGIALDMCRGILIGPWAGAYSVTFLFVFLLHDERTFSLFCQRIV